MTDSTPRDAHTETNAHHASVCKSCAMSCATDKPASCQGPERLSRLELAVKRLHLAVWVTLVTLVLFLVFMFGQRTQNSNAMMHERSNRQGEMGLSNPHGPNGMPGSMRGMNGNPNGNRNPNGNFEVRIERYENDNDNGRNNDDDGDRDHDKPKKHMNKNGGSNHFGGQPPQPPAPPSGAK